jgi:hypothetical protein
MPVKVDDPTDIQSAYDDLANPQRTSSALRNAETSTGDSAYVNSGLDQLEAFANDPSNQVKDAEERGSSGGWTVNRSNQPDVKTSPGSRMKTLLKKGGPTGGIVGGLIAAAFGLSTALGPATLLNHITAGFLEKWDTRSTTSTIRTNKLLVRKLVGDNTSGSCNYVKLMCRFNRPSNKLLRNLEKQGVRALDAAGEVINPNRVLPNTARPKTFEFTRGDGVKTNYTTAQFSRALQDDIEFRKAFHTAYNPRFNNFVDSVFTKVLSRFGGAKTSKLAGATDDASAKEKINADVGGEDIGAKAAAGEATEEAAEGVMKKILNKEMSEIISKLGKSGKGDTFGLVAGVACLAADAPGIAAKVVRAYQMAQLVKYALVFLTVADKIKAGDATSTEVSALGAILTAVTRDSSGTVTNKAATDSFGVKYGLFGDTSNTTTTRDYKKFSPGGNIVSSLSGITQYTDSKTVNDTCSFATNPLTGASINLALATGGGPPGILAAALNIAIGYAAGWGLEQAAGPIAEYASGLLQPAFQSMLGYFLGDLTQNISGEDAGNALASGAAHMLGQSANAGGNVPLSITSALAFEKVTDQVNLAYAEEDRVGRSPLDVSSPNTFLGSIANKMIPYTSSMSSVTSVFSAISSISLGSVGSLLGTTASADSAAEYTMCDDRSINDGKMASGPFCNIIYGIPTEYLGTDPGDVAQYMVNSGVVNEDTGEVVADKDYDLWVSTCLDGKTDQAANCQIDSDNQTVSSEDKRKFAYYALYTVDHQIQKTMDGEEVVNTTSTTTPSDDTDTDDGSDDTDDTGGGEVTSIGDIAFPLAIKKGDITTSGSAWTKTYHESTCKYYYALDLMINTKRNIQKTVKIIAMHDGTVVKAGYGGVPGYGNMIVIHDSDGLNWSTLHVDKVGVKQGQKVKKGDVIGVGVVNANGYHLHVDLSKGSRRPTACASCSPKICPSEGTFVSSLRPKLKEIYESLGE